ncbi:MAG: ABC transporter permease [Nitrososphaerota archaeon]|nr:ABC transporter permease [Nitrososphaerota archaeon]
MVATASRDELDNIRLLKEETAQQLSQESRVEKTRSTGRSLNIDSLPVRIGLFIASLGIFLGCWQVLALIINKELILAGPIPTLQAVVDLLENKIPANAVGLSGVYSAMLTTLEIIVAGFALSLVGIPIGVVMGRWKSAESIIDPWINAIYAIPMVALVPVLYFAIGAGFFADVFIAFMLAVFMVTLNTFSGVRYVSNNLAEIGKTFGASEGQFLRKIVLPASLPDIVAGLRLGLGRAVLGAVVAEVLLSRNSLGDMMMAFQELLNTPFMMGIVFLIAILGIIALQTPKLVERYMFKWKESERLSRRVGR